MSIQEIRDLIAKKITGQGTQVDVGGGLPAILNAICDLLATIPSPYTLPAATTEALGGVKIGNGLQVAADGTASLKVPVITEALLPGVSVEISEARYQELYDTPLLFHSGRLAVILPPFQDISDVIDRLSPSADTVSLFCKQIHLDDTGVLDSYSIICLYTAGEKYYLELLEI